VTPPSPLVWHPGAEMSGLMRPSSVGPQEEKELVRSVLESTEPTVMWFLAQAGGAVEKNSPKFPLSSPRQRVTCRSFPFAQMILRGEPREPAAMESMSAEVMP